MENTTSHASGKTQLILIVSNVMGTESVEHQGFDWKVLPVTADDLTTALDNHQIMETENHVRMLKWQKEHMVADGPVEEPGVLIWFVELLDSVIDITDKNPEMLYTLMAVAVEATKARPAHIRSDFEGGTNATLAEKILENLKEMQPIKINKVGLSHLAAVSIH